MDNRQPERCDNGCPREARVWDGGAYVCLVCAGEGEARGWDEVRNNREARRERR